MPRIRIRISMAIVGFLLASAWLAAGDVRIGAHTGLSVPRIHGDDSNPYSRGFTSRFGPFFGLSFETRLTGRLSLAAEINYTSQGGLRKGLQPITMDLPEELGIPAGTMLFANFRNETILDYLEFPVMGRLTFGERKRFFVDAGPYLGFLVLAKAKTRGVSAIYLDEAGTQPIIIPPDTEPLQVDLGAKTDVKEGIHNTNVGLIVGIGVTRPLGRGQIVLEARGQLGLSTLQRDTANGDDKTGAFIISLGYTFALGKGK